MENIFYGLICIVVIWVIVTLAKKRKTVDDKPVEIETSQPDVVPTVEEIPVVEEPKKEVENPLDKIENPDKNKPFAKISSPSPMESTEYKNNEPPQPPKPKRCYNKKPKGEAVVANEPEKDTPVEKKL